MNKPCLPLWTWAITAALLFVFTIGASIGYTIYYVHEVEQTQCNALDGILGYAHLGNKQLHSAIAQWAVSYR